MTIELPRGETRVLMKWIYNNRGTLFEGCSAHLEKGP